LYFLLEVEYSPVQKRALTPVSRMLMEMHGHSKVENTVFCSFS